MFWSQKFFQRRYYLDVMNNSRKKSNFLVFQVRIYGVSLAISFLWILMLTFSINEQLIGDNLQQENGPISVGCIIFNLLCLLILWICVPPTTRKTYSDIFSYLSSKSKWTWIFDLKSKTMLIGVFHITIWKLWWIVHEVNWTWPTSALMIDFIEIDVTFTNYNIVLS